MAMINYRRGAIFGLTVAEMFILLTFLLLIALLGLVQSKEPDPPADEDISARVWVRPEDIETLVNAADKARTAKELAEKALKEAEAAQQEAEHKNAVIESERDQALETINKLRGEVTVVELANTVIRQKLDQAYETAEEASTAKELAEKALKEAEVAQQETEQKNIVTERERDLALETVNKLQSEITEIELASTAIRRKLDQAYETAEQTRTAKELAEKALKEAEVAQQEAEQKNVVTERERDLALDDARIAQEENAAIKNERDQARRDLEIIRHKGKNPPCWYELVDTVEGKKRERAMYVFKVAIHNVGFVLGKLKPPPGGAFDDSDRTYADEWTLLELGELPYGEKLEDGEFEKIGEVLSGKGKNRQVRTYECTFSVRVWDETSEDAKERWKYAHDKLIEKYFGTFSMKDPWDGYK